MEAGLALGGSFLSAFLQVAFDRIASSRKLTALFQGKRKLQLNRLERILQTIYVVLEDAEYKQARSKAVRTWFDSLKHVVHQADDLLDEINTECMRIKIDHPQETSSDAHFSDHLMQELSPRLEEICDALESFATQIGVLGLKILDAKKKRVDWRPSTSVVIESQIFGRDEEKEKIIQMVLSEGGDSDISVIPITGMGGVGKTTLAQLVYNDERVKNRFETRAWICVSEDYDAHKVTETILMELNPSVVDKDDFNRLQVKLRDNIQGKLFLIILDDIWNDSYNDWLQLVTPLYYGSRGSKIIVTTRNEKVALMMQDVPFHSVQPIMDDHSWSLFKSHVFYNRSLTPLHEFESIGRAIVEKCKGLPLAIKTVAGALRSKRDICEWHEILSSDIWMVGDVVLPALNLSYELLPSHLKCCFAFCAVFPKDTPIDKEEVVLLWLANGLVQPSTKKHGQNCFEELRSRSFFEMNGKKYLMHDLINDLARYVSGNFYVRIEDYQSKDLHSCIAGENYFPLEVQHVSYLSFHYDTSIRFRRLSQVQSLRTLLSIHQYRYASHLTTLFLSDILPKFQRIRALTLSEYKISMVPDSIGNLKHLRLLNLAMTNIKQLPNAVTKCLNLQTLILANCRELEELPEDMRLLINLFHLDVQGVSNILIRKMASWLSMLKHIQNLSIVVDKIQGSVLDQLNDIEVRQSLVVTGLEDAVSVEITKKAEVINKKTIENLTLEWSGVAADSTDELNIFAQLRPHTNTKQLSVKGYRGTVFSSWLGDSSFSNMVSVSLQDCKNCFFLPPLGQLSALKKLHMSGLSKITEVGDDLYGNSSIFKPFQALEELRFSRMSEWTTWNTHPDRVEFSSLREFSIRDCPKLVGDIPFHLTSLRKIVIKGLPNLQVANDSNLLSQKKMPQAISYLQIRDCPTISLSLQSSSIKELVIGQCKHVEFPPSGSCNSSLESLKILKCGDSLEVIPLFSFIKLRVVSIFYWDSPKLFKFLIGFHQTLTALQSLRIHHCNNILSFPEGGLAAPNLKELVIWYCKKLKSLPEQMHTQLSSLYYLVIVSCPEIECFPEQGLPSSLETLCMSDCKRLIISQTNWGLQRLPPLTHLSIGGSGSDDKLFPKEGLLPSSLQVLNIWRFSNLEALDQKGFQHLTSLHSLSIKECTNLRYFPEDGLPSSLSKLEISNCPKLKARVETKKGEDWSKVSSIPIIRIDGELIS